MKKLNLNLFSLFFFLLTTILSAEEKIISGKAKITDGDTIVINQIKIRFFGIDAPEKKQICKKNYLKFLISSSDML